MYLIYLQEDRWITDGAVEGCVIIEIGRSCSVRLDDACDRYSGMGMRAP